MKQTEQQQRRLFELFPLWIGAVSRLVRLSEAVADHDLLAVVGIRGGLCCAHHSPCSDPRSSQRHLAGTICAGRHAVCGCPVSGVCRLGQEKDAVTPGEKLSECEIYHQNHCHFSETPISPFFSVLPETLVKSCKGADVHDFRLST